MSKEQFFSHNQVKSEYNLVLGGLAKVGRLGRYVPDGMLLTNDEADLASQPDGAFVSYESLTAGRVRLVEGDHEGYVELAGTPDMVLEIISTSSVEKDTVTQPASRNSSRLPCRGLSARATCRKIVSVRPTPFLTNMV